MKKSLLFFLIFIGSCYSIRDKTPKGKVICDSQNMEAMLIPAINE